MRAVSGLGARLAYRPELDGLRGAAVALVIANHAGVLPNGAGNVGVTAFFVLSGYLITSLLVAERETTGGIDLRAFYVRRVRRLLPALLAMLAVTLAIFGPTYLLPTLAAAFYWADLAPLLHVPLGQLSHTWSLSLEEQFYALWPLAFVRLAHPRRWLVIGLAASILGQLIFPDGPARFITRADGIIVGCLLALTPIRFGWWPVACLGVAATVWANPLPIAMTVASAALLLSAPQFLRNRALVRVGQISYGLYLWHFVILGIVGPWSTCCRDHIRSGACVGAMGRAAIPSPATGAR